MKKKDVVVGKTYRVKVSGIVVPVRLWGESLHGGWDGTNMVTGRAVRVKTAGRLRGEHKPTWLKPAGSAPTVAERVRADVAKLFA
jgi:hypothetical protein